MHSHVFARKKFSFAEGIFQTYLITSHNPYSSGNNTYRRRGDLCNHETTFDIALSIRSPPAATKSDSPWPVPERNEPWLLHSLSSDLA